VGKRKRGKKKKKEITQLFAPPSHRIAVRLDRGREEGGEKKGKRVIDCSWNFGGEDCPEVGLGKGRTP